MYVQSFPLAIHQVETLSSSVDCSSTGIIQSTDSDAHTNYHVFHNRSAFEEYELTAPLTIKGFRHDLSATAIGRGTVYLEANHGHEKHLILLCNVLHILADRTNLISGVQLDKASIIATLGDNTIQLCSNN